MKQSLLIRKGSQCGMVLLLVGILLGRTGAGAESLLDPTFDPGTGPAEGIVESVLCQPDGQILICGNFTSFNGNLQGFIARLNPNGSVDTNFVAHPGYWVRHMALQRDGKIVIGGFFTNVEGLPRNRIARLNSDGSLDRSFDPGLGAETKIVEGDDKDPFVFAVAVQPDDKILITGNFRTYNGVARSGLARLNSDGSLDTTFHPSAGFDSWGRSLLLLTNGQFIATGWFTSYDNHSVNRMVRVNPDGTADEAFKPFFGDKTAIYSSVVLPGGKYIAAGHSINEQGLFRQELARLNTDGTFDTNYHASANEKVESVFLQPDGSIILGGYFSLVNGQTRNGLARLGPDGALDPGFKAETDNFVWTVTDQPDGKILVCGGFLTVDGVSRPGVARLIATTNTNTNVVVSTELADPVLAAGRFSVQVPTVIGKRYTLQYQHPGGDRWLSLPGISGDGAGHELVDPQAGRDSSRLYRVRID